MSQATNIYNEEIDFAALALQDADFARVLKPNGQLDFSNPESVQQLTKSLLKRDFGLIISLPNDRLCPPVPNRLNYILWIQALLDTTSESYTDKYDPAREVLGVDIGTGASCIYPLLGCSQRSKWRFIATDIDEKSFEFAKKNVEANGAGSRIQLRRTRSDGPLIPQIEQEIDFTMCNPPFYGSQDEMLESAASKQRPPFTACTGSASEMVTTGGEIAFVSRMIDESLSLTEGVQWYSSMLGKFSSLGPLVEKLKKHGITNWAVTEFVQGSKTRRWGIAWSFGDLRPTIEWSRAAGSLQKGLLPFPSEYHFNVNSQDVIKIGEQVNGMLSQLPLKWMWKAAIKTGLGFSQTAVWSRASRRKASKAGEGIDSAVKIRTSGDDDEPSFGFKVHVSTSVEPIGTKVNIRWIKGVDSVTFESFCGMVKRKIEEAN